MNDAGMKVLCLAGVSAASVILVSCARRLGGDRQRRTSFFRELTAHRSTRRQSCSRFSGAGSGFPFG